MTSFSLKSPRCGRCAEPIPEDTSSYCKFCGVPFFKVPPTTDFHLIAEEHVRRSMRAQRLIGSIFTLLLVMAGISFLYLTVKHHQLSQVAELRVFPKLRFYFYDFPEFPSLTRAEKTEAAYIAVQSFADHFGLPIDDYEVLHDALPSQLSFLSTGYFSDLSSFSFWDERVFEKDLQGWVARDREPLNIVVSNFPIYLGESKKIESRHLNGEKLISGLGHPSLVLATSFRLLKELKLKTPAERARHMGEYVLSHELGHGLLGIPDYVIKNDPVFMRGPASVQSTHYLAEHCLMHTDAGGGALAWESIKERKLGAPVSCAAYREILDANRLRERAVRLAHEGKISEAADTMSLAVAQIRAGELSKSWVRAIWEKELRVLQPALW